MQYRVLTSEDAAGFQRLRLQGLQETPIAFSSSYEEERDRDLSLIASRLEPDETGVVFGAFLDSTLVGVTGVRRETHSKLAHKAWLWGVYVAPEQRRKGIGRELILRTLDHAFSRFGVRQVNLGVNTASQAAKSLYESLGFVAFGLERAFQLVDGVFYDELHMVCLGEEYASRIALNTDSP